MFIELNHAVKKYGRNETEIRALDGASFSLEEGHICVILGPSGSGKSTLLNMLGGLDSLDGGELHVAGQNITSLSARDLTEYRRQDIGFVFQYYNLIADLTVQENIEVVADITDDPLDLDEVLKALDIEAYRRRFPRELSGGQQQRVAIARAMIKNPRFLLCDEITGALDTKSSEHVLQFIAKMNQTFGTTIIMITHNEAIAAMADQIVRLRDGRVIESRINAAKIPASDLSL